ncbi:hypothetical protein DEJ28_08775 [Curtobacterium sp. MCPF17_002]|uniref:hypothetical protein n=1 Tax=Curtobacterium sp. MCPF17_002 TaxID=2175645 RepID=UPI000DA75406|nr:hypothetical protein [Curtobacterium sp. MCPF17_002]WIB79178.1 hypothetical protein DEJ28_08775 [Curtobacterium sp. MCPF17_002]
MSDPRDDDDLGDFREAQDTDYTPDPTVHDPDDLPVADGGDDELVPDDDRPVPLDEADPRDEADPLDGADPDEDPAGL